MAEGVRRGQLRRHHGQIAQSTHRVRGVHGAEVREDDRVAAVGGQRGLEIDHPVDLPPVDGDDPIERPQSRAVGRRVAPGDADDGRWEARDDADAPDVIDDVELARLRLVCRRERRLHSATVAQDDHAHRSPGVPRDGGLHVGEARHVFPVDRRDSIPGHELPVRRPPRQDDPDHRRKERPVLEEHRRIERDREDDVHRRPGEDDHDPLPQRLRLERPRALLGEDHVGLVPLEHLHEPAEREEPDAVLGLFAADPDHFGAEPNGERDHLHAEDLREGEVSTPRE